MTCAKAIRHRAVVLLCHLLLASAAYASDSAHRPTLQDIDTITILPVAFPAAPRREAGDPRPQSSDGDLNEYVYKGLLRKLAMKGYVLDKPRGWTTPENWSVETLRSRPPAELAALAPASSSYVAFLFIERIEASSQGVRSSADAMASAMILHRESGTVVWERSGKGKFSENILGGLVPMWLTPDKPVVIEKAFQQLFAELPEAQPN